MRSVFCRAIYFLIALSLVALWLVVMPFGGCTHSPGVDVGVDTDISSDIGIDIGISSDIGTGAGISSDIGTDTGSGANTPIDVAVYAGAVICNNDEYSLYPETVGRMLPSYTVRTASNMPYYYLESGMAAEAFGAQAVPAIEVGAARHWYPQYLATAVIAVDRDRTGAQVKSWSDLPHAGEEVGISITTMNREMLMAAISYGIDGWGFDLRSAAGLLASLNADGRLVVDSFAPPIVICFDYQAAAQIKSGRNIEIIVPTEGTLTYEKGLLSNTEIAFENGIDMVLLSAGFRLLDGCGDPAFYPEATAYGSTAGVTDYVYFNSVCQDAVRILRRNVLHTHLYSSADGREHHIFALAYIVIVTAWMASLIYRVAQKNIRQIIAFVGIALIGWIVVRMIKYQVDSASVLSRYLWYSYYLFMLLLPICILWMAWAIDKPNGGPLPKWLLGLFSVYVALVALVMTNDLHNLVFRLDLANPNWAAEYSYGIVYFVILAFCFMPPLIAIGMLIYKGRQGVRKSGVAFSFALIALLAAYSFGYATRIPIAWWSDLTMSVGIFAIMLMETTVRSGMVPANSKYAALFANSPLGMRVVDYAGQTAWSSPAALQHWEEGLALALEKSPASARYDEDTLLFANEITGGYALWQEDVSDLNRLHKETEESMRKLELANAVLADEEKVKRAAEAENARTALMAQLEGEIAKYTIRLSTMLEQLESMVDRRKATMRASLLLCYIKRRCALFFREREAEELVPGELASYLEEIAEIPASYGINVVVTNELDSRVAVRRATLMYDFFYNVVYWATWLENLTIIAHLGFEAGAACLGLLTSDDAHSFQMETGLERAIASENGAYTVRGLDDEAVSLKIHFPKDIPVASRLAYPNGLGGGL